MKNNLYSEISKILTKEYKMVDLEAVDAILALIKKHEREVIEKMYKELTRKNNNGNYIYTHSVDFLDYLAKLKDPEGLKEVEK